MCMSVHVCVFSDNFTFFISEVGHSDKIGECSQWVAIAIAMEPKERLSATESEIKFSHCFFYKPNAHKRKCMYV